MSLPGIVGHHLRTRPRRWTTRSPTDALVVMHSDGLTDGGTSARYPGLLAARPLVVAATLLRDAGVRRDDAGVLACRADGR